MTRIEVCELGAAADAAGLLAEYDTEDDAIRVSARAVARVRDAAGEAEAERFVACAIAHESHHRAFPAASEAQAHAAAAAACGVDPRRYESFARASRG